MKMKNAITFFVASLGVVLGVAQQYKTDTLITKGTSTHMYLNIAVPAGEVNIQSSGVCGQSVARLASPNQSLQPRMIEDADGNITYTVSVENGRTARLAPTARMDAMRAKSVRPAPAHINRFKQQLANLGSFSGKAKDYTTEFRADPTLSTELYINVGSGGSNLDLSGLNLYKVAINSAFSDINISYSKPNLCVMKKMDVHAARANVVMENIEYARAELISVQNDMGETRLILGNNESPGSTIFLSAGTGNCYISIHRDHPARVVIRKGYLARVEVKGNFEIIDKNAFGNTSYNTHEGTFTTIICNMDFGKIYIQETRN